MDEGVFGVAADFCRKSHVTRVHAMECAVRAIDAQSARA
jgi:hypothetical protein